MFRVGSVVYEIAKNAEYQDICNLLKVNRDTWQMKDNNLMRDLLYDKMCNQFKEFVRDPIRSCATTIMNQAIIDKDLSRIKYINKVISGVRAYHISLLDNIVLLKAVDKNLDYITAIIDSIKLGKIEALKILVKWTGYDQGLAIMTCLNTNPDPRIFELLLRYPGYDYNSLFLLVLGRYELVEVLIRRVKGISLKVVEMVVMEGYWDIMVLLIKIHPQVRLFVTELGDIRT